MPYATTQEFIDRYDVRLLGDLASDTDTRIDTPALLTDTRLLASLTDAAADIDAALMYARKLSADQLAQIQAAGDDTLRRINVDLALGYLYSGRGRGVPDGHRQRIEAATDQLAAIRKGTAVLNVDSIIQASIGTAVRSIQSTRVGQNLAADLPVLTQDRARLDPPIK